MDSMEPQVSIRCKKVRSNSCCCLSLLISLFAFLLSFAVGVLIGAVTGLFSLIGLGAFIVLLTLLVTVLAGLIIYYFCKDCKRNGWR